MIVLRFVTLLVCIFSLVKFHKKSDKNNVKVSCSCLANFACVIKSHNTEYCLKRQPKANLNIIADIKILVIKREMV